MGKADSGSSFVLVPSVRICCGKIRSCYRVSGYAEYPTELIRGDSVRSRKLYFVYSLQRGKGLFADGERTEQKGSATSLSDRGHLLIIALNQLPEGTLRLSGNWGADLLGR